MTQRDINHERLVNLHLAKPIHKKPEEVVSWLGAVQAQDFAAAKWALALRARGLTDAALEKAFAEGALLRTHVMRPTWHFVTPHDIRWMLALTGPRVKARMAPTERSLGLETASFKRSQRALVKALQGENQLTRSELNTLLKKAGFKTNNLGYQHLIMHAELDGVICSGPRRGKQFTYMLLDERVPPSRSLDREEAISELAGRYFQGHGPATLQDFAWWSGLSAADARRGLESIKSGLASTELDGRVYWSAAAGPHRATSAPNTYLLPNYDEYIVGYADRSTIYDPLHNNKLDARGNMLFMHTLVISGRVEGIWKRTLKKDEVLLEIRSFRSLSAPESQVVAAAAQKYGEFIGLPVRLTRDL